ncbi:CoA transferase subunit A [Lysinibacillus sp. LZ02]|uniref:CoA transferase subunit A n=1 Tax=Lysinibacillus sp. LZ02 TaxID=3420668 RepID=UPI003D36DD91
MKRDKQVSVLEAISRIQSGMSIMVGGFGLIGSPLTLIEQLTEHDVKDLTIYSNNIGESGKGLGKILQQGKIKKAVGSYFTSNRDVVKLYNKGEMEVELLPQGTFAEAIRAGGAGLGGFYTKTAVGTKLAEDKEIKVIDGEEYLFQKSLRADVAIIRAWKADRAGNLIYYKTARNFNPNMATAASYVIAEVDEIVEVGELSSDEIVTPHLYVDAIVESRLVLTKEGVVERDKCKV